MLRLAVCLLVALALPAQGGDSLPVVIVSQEQILEKSLAGQEFRRREEAETALLVTERKRIEAEFEAEEKRLADLRPTMERAAFAQLAAEFDAKVREARATQDQKAQAAARAIEQNRQAFIDSLRPVLGEVMRRYGANVMLDSRSVVLSDPSIDITGDVIARIDELYRARPAPQPGPGP